MGCWFHAKTIKVSCYIDADEVDEDDDLDGEGIDVAYLVSDHEGGDCIDIEVNGDSQRPPEEAVQVAKAIMKIDAWSRTKAGRTEIQKLRDKHEERAKAEDAKREARAAAKAAEDGCPDAPR